MVVYRLLGSGVTDANGVASVNYTGAGAGEMDLVASTSNPITQSSLVSETFVLWDTLFFDTGLDESKNSQWYVDKGTGTKELTENGLKLSNPTDTTRYDLFVQQTGKPNYFYWDAPFCVEVDITEMVGNPRLQIYSIQTNEAYNGISSIGHWKIEYDGTTVRPYRNGTALTTFERNMPNARIGFYIVTGGSITYKNFKIYSI